MIRSVLLGSVVFVSVATAAVAADLPSRRAPPAYIPPPLPAAFTWTGAYLGINAGYAFDGDNRYALSGNDALATSGITGGNVSPFAQTRSSGFTGGGQVGYNYQLGNGFGPGGLVLGVEADAAYTDLNRANDIIGAGGTDTTYRSRTDFVGTVRGRVGYAFDRFMIYGTGGFAYGGVNNGVNIAVPGSGGGYAGAHDTIRTGYAYGGGVEYALPTTSFFNVFNSSAVTLKAEFIHYDLGTSAFTLNGTPGTVFAGSSFTSRVRTDGNLARAGLNFKFGSPVAAPVVARY